MSDSTRAARYLTVAKKNGLYGAVLVATIIAYFVYDWMNYPINQLVSFAADAFGLAPHVRPTFSLVVTVTLLPILAFLVTLLLRLVSKWLAHRWREGSKLSIITSALTIVMILFEWLVPALEHRLGASAVELIREWQWLPLLMVYTVLQMFETAERNTTNSGGYLVDNGLALASFIQPILLFGFSTVSPPWRMTPNEQYIMLQLLCFAFVDLAFGLYISQRIASAGRERVETTRAAS